MKNLLKNYCAALVLTGILSVGSGLTLVKSATAAAVTVSPETTNEFTKQNLRQTRLPRSVINAVLRDLSAREGISRQKLQVINYNQQTWRNGCLELPQNNELCTQVLVPGWLVGVSDGKQNWIYHTNSNGRSVRLAAAKTPTNNLPTKLPQSIKNVVLRDASARLQQPVARLNILDSQQRTWRDGCLELADANQVCTAALVSGWRVVVGAVNQTLIYHTNQTGTVVRVNEKASEINDPKPSSLKPVPIPANQLPPPLDRNVLFRQISSGGLTGRTYETVLLNDGRLIRVRIGDANDSERTIRQISSPQVQQFQQLLERSRFGEFKNLSYPAPNIAADYITYTLTSREGTVQYNDISQNNLPQNLQVVVKAWTRINTRL
ncbi:hypothetical protein [Calothrix sp. PCC 7507]|uniref:hypothetical protein n=1 Tax=Calothrix sp. PCC 7507 TaxID=99598 RepID=UPI00029F016C|nr:hypothetical protein [Calothrix sp. PCC 7507]AFY34430.1 hypothetical protein Cal7507_4046 [Calothrix sp. PCC 7507]